MTGTFYTKEELQEWTGRKRKSLVIQQLREYGVRFDIAADGWPRVFRDSPKKRKEIEPNIAFLDNLR